MNANKEPTVTYTIVLHRNKKDENDLINFMEKHMKNAHSYLKRSLQDEMKIRKSVPRYSHLYKRIKTMENEKKKKAYQVEFGGSYDTSHFVSEDFYLGESAEEIAERVKKECLKGEWAAHTKRDFDNGKAWFEVSDEDGNECIRVDSLD